jgi:hypothetical protein
VQIIYFVSPAKWHLGHVADMAGVENLVDLENES